jgi:hypothetical protein
MANDEFKRVMKGIKDPDKHNPEHKARLKRDAKTAKALDKGGKKTGKGIHRKGGHGDDVIDSGMFS